MIKKKKTNCNVSHKNYNKESNHSKQIDMIYRRRLKMQHSFLSGWWVYIHSKNMGDCWCISSRSTIGGITWCVAWSWSHIGVCVLTAWTWKRKRNLCVKTNGCFSLNKKKVCLKRIFVNKEKGSLLKRKERLTRRFGDLYFGKRATKST